MQNHFKKRNRITLLIVLLVVTTFYGCKPLYVPNVVNTPLFSNKNEFQAAVHMGTAGFDPQLAYSITNNIGIMANGSFEIFQTTDTTIAFPHKHSFGELGIGYYTKLAGKQRFEVYGGYGIGNIKFEEFDINNIPYEAKVKTNRYFIQPAYGITTEHIDFSVASRFIWITGEGGADLKYTRSFWEPAVTGRFGGANVKGVIQAGLSLPFQEGDYIDYEPFLFSVGIQASFGKIFE